MKRALYLQKTIVSKQFRIKSSICILGILSAIFCYVNLSTMTNEIIKNTSPYLTAFILLFTGCYFVISKINHSSEIKRINSDHEKDKHQIVKEFIDGLNMNARIEEAIVCYDKENCMAYEFLYEEIIRLNPPQEFSKELYYIYLNRYKENILN